MNRAIVSGVAVLFGWLCLAAPSQAERNRRIPGEGFVDVYTGPAFVSDDAGVEAELSTGADIDLGTDYSTSPSLGVRGGYWFPGAARWLGLALDLSWYRGKTELPLLPQLEADVIAFTPLALVRLPLLASDDFPTGRVQPYLGAGPGLSLSLGRLDFSSGTAFDDLVDVEFDVGADARGGVAVPVTNLVTVFTEYRFTYLRVEYDDSLDVFDFTPDVEVDATLKTHHLTFGVSFRF